MSKMSTAPTVLEKTSHLSLQGLIAVYAANYTPNRRFHNLQLWLDIYTELEINLSYKQIRNALYRLQSYYCIRHVGRGWYIHDIQ